MQPNDYEITHDRDFPSFVEIQADKFRHRIDELQQQLEYVRMDSISGWLAAGLLLVALGITLYQWLAVSHTGDIVDTLRFWLGAVCGLFAGTFVAATHRFWVGFARQFFELLLWRVK